MKTAGIVMVLLFSFCCLGIPEAAEAQYFSDGTVYTVSRLQYDAQTGYILAEGNSDLHTPFAEVATGADWQLTVELYGPNGYVGSDTDHVYASYDVSMYAYVSTYADESGYGDYTTYATPTMLAGSLDYLGFYYFPDMETGVTFFTNVGGPYYQGMPCYDGWLGFYQAGPCYPDPPAPYLEDDYDLGTSEESMEAERRLTLLSSSCTFNAVIQQTVLLGGWSQGLSCILTDQYPVPGSFNPTCTTRSDGVHCYAYQITKNGRQCTVMVCPGATRSANSDCTGFTDTFPVEDTETCF